MPELGPSCSKLTRPWSRIVVALPTRSPRRSPDVHPTGIAPGTRGNQRASGVISRGGALAAQQLGGLEREVERLASVEPRVALGLVALLQVVAEHLCAPADALGDV